MKCLVFIFKFTFLLEFAVSAKILCIFPIPFYSHQSALQTLPGELAGRGHKLVVISPEPRYTNVENITEIDIKEITNAKWDEHFIKAAKDLKTFAISAVDFVKIAFKTIYLIADVQFSANEVQNLIKGHEEFDLILAEDSPRTAALIGARFKAPIILISSYNALHESFEQVGSETNPLLFPFLQRIPETYWERMSVFLDVIRIKLQLNLEKEYNELIRKHFGEKAPLVGEVRKNVKMVFLSMQRMWDNNRAVTPAVTYMGPIHLKEQKPLPMDLKNFLENSKRGVVYMSLGSKIKSSDIPPETLKIVLRVLGSLPYDVLWKWDREELLNRPENVRLEKWLPQADLLHHPSIKVFVTQGGLQSTDEALAAGVPLVGLPVMADQYQNVQKYQQYGIGLGLDIDDLREEDFRKAILEVAENERYRDNMIHLRRILFDQRYNGLHRAVTRIEHLLEHGPIQSYDVTAFEYYMLDIFALLLTVAFLSFVLIVFLVRLVCRSLKNTVHGCRQQGARAALAPPWQGKKVHRFFLSHTPLGKTE